MHTLSLRSLAVFAVGAALVLASIALVTPSAHAVGLTEGQIQAILNLIQSFGADAATIASASAALHGQATSGNSGGSTTSTPASSPSCLTLSSYLAVGSNGNDVTRLQQFLGISPTTGYFGLKTQAALAAWQTAHGLDDSGQADTQTRAAIGCAGNAQTSTPAQSNAASSNSSVVTSSLSVSATSVIAGQPVTLSWSSSANNCDVLRNESNGGYTLIAPSVGSATSYTLYPAATGTYTVNCFGTATNGKDAPSASKSVTIFVTPNPAPTCTLTATSNTPSISNVIVGGVPYYTVRPNSNLTLTWTNQNAEYASVNGDKDLANDSQTFYNLTNIVNTYSVTVYGKGGSSTCSTTVYVDYKG